jgi:hydantoinase/carbamoylase family amidase
MAPAQGMLALPGHRMVAVADLQRATPERHDRIDPGRVVRRLEQLFTLGSPPHANRPGLSADEQAAIDLAASWMVQAGLDVETDAFGNLFGRLPGTRPELPEVWTGSHLDTVPAGGRFDGALGVVVGIEALGALAGAGAGTRTIAVVSFRDEEGWRFGGGTFGSRGICGRVRSDELDHRDREGVSLRAALQRLGLRSSAPGGPGQLPGAFVELHVEQGPVLAAAEHALGCVTAIVGMVGGEVVIEGRASHAGTTPMSHRTDAVVAAAHVITALTRAASGFPDAVATVGAIEAEPGASNVIAAQTILSVDLRAPDDAGLDALVEAVEEAMAQATARTGCRCRLRGLWRQAPIVTSPEVRAAILAGADRCGESIRPISSGALHDAAVLAQAGVRTGMIFARSNAGGVSHTPEEDTDPAAIRAAAHVLTHTLQILATDEA